MLIHSYLFDFQILIPYFRDVKLKKNIFLLFLAAIFLISTTGVTVYKHYCSHGGMFYGVFVDVAHGCEPEEAEEFIKTHDCCATSSDSGLKVEEDCCTSDVKMYQIDTDLSIHDFKVDFTNHFILSLSSSVSFLIPEYKEISTSNKAPPALTTQKRLSLFQMYLI